MTAFGNLFGLRHLRGVTTLALDESKCRGCGLCAIVCPHRVWRVNGGKAEAADRDACMECGACAKNCPDEAIFVRAGVGCLEAIVRGALTGAEPTCDCACGPGCCN